MATVTRSRSRSAAKLGQGLDGVEVCPVEGVRLGGQPAAGRRRLAPAVLAGEQPAGQREVRQQTLAGVLDGRDQLGLGAAVRARSTRSGPR